jgi:hypothetical protein
MTMTQVKSTTHAFRGQQPIATSHYGLGGDSSIIQHISISWDAVLAAVITIWSTDFPVEEVVTTSVAAQDWCQEQPPSGYTAISPAGAATVGASPLILTIPGGTAGCASMNIGNLGSERLKAQVVCTVAGQLRIRTNGKE